MAGLGRNVEQGHSCDDQKEAADLGYAQGFLEDEVIDHCDQNVR